MTELRSKPVVNLDGDNRSAVLKALDNFAFAQPELAGFVVTDSSRKSNDDDVKQGQLFEPTTRHDLLSQGLATGTNFLNIDRHTGELDIVPPMPDANEHNRLLNLATSVATLAVASS